MPTLTCQLMQHHTTSPSSSTTISTWPTLNASSCQCTSTMETTTVNSDTTYVTTASYERNDMTVYPSTSGIIRPPPGLALTDQNKSTNKPEPMKVDTATQIEPKKFDDDIYNYPVVRDYFDFGINLQAPPETHTGRARVRELNTAS